MPSKMNECRHCTQYRVIAVAVQNTTTAIQLQPYSQVMGYCARNNPEFPFLCAAYQSPVEVWRQQFGLNEHGR